MMIPAPLEFHDKIPWNEISVCLAAVAAWYTKNIGSAIKKVKYQVTKNDGGSLLDAITRIETSVAGLTAVHEATQQLSQNPIFKADRNGECIWVNTAYTLITGKSIEDLKGHGWISLVHDEDREIVRREWDAAVKDIRRFELPYKVVNDRMGTTYLVKCTSYPIIVKNEITGYIGVWSIIDKLVDMPEDAV